MRHEVVNALKNDPALVRVLMSSDKNQKIQALKAAGLYHPSLNKVMNQNAAITPKGYSCVRCTVCI